MYSMATLCNTHAKSTNVIYVYYGYIMYYTCEIDTCNICILWLHMHVIYAFYGYTCIRHAKSTQVIYVYYGYTCM